MAKIVEEINVVASSQIFGGSVNKFVFLWTGKQKKIATVKFSSKTGKLTIKGKQKGKFTITIKSGKAAKKIKVTVK